MIAGSVAAAELAPDALAGTIARLRATPDALFERELRSAVSAYPTHRDAILQGAIRGTSVERRLIVERVKAQDVAAAPENLASPEDGLADATAAATGSREAAVRTGTSKGLLVGGGLAALALAAAGGGGGGDSDSPQATPAPPPPPPPPPPSNPPASFETQEFLRNYSLGLIRAQYAYSAGATGQGILVAVVDEGLSIDHPEFVNRIHPAGLVIRDGGAAMTDPGGHGTHVAGIIAANKDDRVMHGVAFGARLLPIKFIKSEEDPDSPTVTFSEMINRLIQYRPRVANNSWGERTLIGGDKDVYHATRLQDVNPGDYRGVANAYRQVQQVGTVIVFSSGNNVSGDPSKGLQPSLYAALPLAYPELQGQWLAVASVGSDGLITTSSHRCGDARAWCLAAPGSQIVSTWVNNQYAIASGTSMAAPHVSGGLALLMQLFPTLSARQIVERILVSANKSGIYGDQSVYGQGLLNLEAASQPIGAVTSSSSDGQVMVLGPAGYDEGPAGDALGGALRGIDVILKDSLDAPFRYPADTVLLGQRIHRSQDQSLALTRLQSAAYRSQRQAHGWRMGYRSSVDSLGAGRLGEVELYRDNERGGGLSIGVMGSPSWSQGLMRAAPQLRELGALDAFSNPIVGTQERAISFAWHGAPLSLGQFGLQVAHERRVEGGQVEAWRMASGSAASVLGEWRFAPAGPTGWSAGVQLGALFEQDRVLGARGDLWRGGAYQTRFLGVDLMAPLTRSVALVARYHAGSTQADIAPGQGGVVLRTSGYALGVVMEPNPRWRAGLIANAPLAVAGGQAAFTLPTTLNADNTVGWERVSVALGSGARPLDAELFVGWKRPDGRLEVTGSFVHQRDPLHGLGRRDSVFLLNAVVR